MKRIIFLLILYICVTTTFAQADAALERRTDANIYGHVLDSKSGEHLPFVTIKLKGTTIGITTDHTGHYFLRNLPVGEFTLEASMIGYRSAVRVVTIEAKKSLEVDFTLIEENVSLDAVVVSANRNETTRRMAPSLVSVLNMQMLEVTNSKTLSDGLRFQPGLRYHTGTYQRHGGLIFSDTDRLAPPHRYAGRCLWAGADSRQYD